MATSSTIFIASDHAGHKLAQFVQRFLEEKGFKTQAFLPTTRVDYPDYAKLVCEKVLENKQSYGILVCATGIGMSMCANRFKGIRAALCVNSHMAKMTRLHNNANILCLGEKISGVGVVESILEAFFSTEFEGERHIQRIQKLDT
ncbi:ribose 5-phosphate isomerase B [Helicobacter cetorum]|uniref:Ribose-5-phosphate isomerase B n=1 Tax=Helicobacter cetorum (strain ATCC BAA-540 / CCUG 52418 / MIT 99-5656) TaxID=1163745 RepID=I0EQU1_HELCM|nr:ribose 5-phosphate isomerase B [Helicobacter cetorum]AFI05310.1 ribose-5-phosphate isomerase B [Helicobacter cetorum MIT 99-5656]